MFVAYSVAHSSDDEGPGASTLTGLTEFQAATDYEQPFVDRIRCEGWECRSYVGALSAKVGAINRGINRSRKDGQLWAAVEIHFNSSPLEDCPCGSTRHKGGVCQTCGRKSSVQWRFGSRAMVNRTSRSSSGLGALAITRVARLVGGRSLPIIMIPDSRYPRSYWPRWVTRPAVLVEAGFGCDPVFSEWINDKHHRVDLGICVAEAVIDWAKSRLENDVDLSRWPK